MTSSSSSLPSTSSVGSTMTPRTIASSIDGCLHIDNQICEGGFEGDCKLLGNLLNDILQREAGSTFVDKLEKIRVLSQSACNMRQAGMEDMAEMLEKQLASELSKMTLEEALPLALPLAIILL
ncbi:hypothetical protein JHK86_003990 [Glycine max]|nr:hypothetical protein JHK86_003990 [Glycine max]